MSTLTTYTGGFQLEFEKPLLQLEKQISDLEAKHAAEDSDIGAEVRKLRGSHQSLLKKTYAKLSAWQTVQVARHPGRPQAVDYIRAFVKDFCELHGDRRFG